MCSLIERCVERDVYIEIELCMEIEVEERDMIERK